MDSLNTIFILFLFLGPGLLIKAYSNFITLSNNIRTNKQSIYEQLFLVVVHSIIVTGATIGVINILSCLFIDIVYISSFTDLISNLAIIKYSITYLILSLIICSIWYWIYDSKLKMAIFNYRNKKLEEDYEVTIASPDGFSVWESMVYKKEESEGKTGKYRPVVSVYKDGNYVTAGFLMGFNDLSHPNQELDLSRTYEVDRALKMDNGKEEEDKWLSCIESEYFELQTGITIKFHKKDKLIEHWDEI